MKFAIWVVQKASAWDNAIQNTIPITSKTKADCSPVTIAGFVVRALSSRTTDRVNR